MRTASDLGLLEPFWVLDMGSIGVSDGVNPPPHTLALAAIWLAKSGFGTYYLSNSVMTLKTGLENGTTGRKI